MIEREAQTTILEFEDKQILCDMDAGISDFDSDPSSDEILSTDRWESLPKEEQQLRKFKGFSKNLRKLKNH